MLPEIINSLKKHKYYHLLIPAIILAGIYIRTKLLLYNESFWYDTCALGANINKSYTDLFKPFEYLQCAPPLFMIFSKLIYSVFHYGNDIVQKDFLLRIIPCICGIISLPLFAMLVHKIFKNIYMSIVCTFLLAFNHFAIYYSREFKPYSSDLLISVILLFIFYCVDFNKISLKKLILISCLTASSVWFSFPSVFIISAGILMLFITKSMDYKKITIICFPVLISLLLFFFIFFKPVYYERDNIMLVHWVTDEMSFFTASNFLEMFRDKLYNLIKLNLPIVLFYLFFTANIVILFLQKNKKAVSLILIPIILTIFANLLYLYPFQNRLLLFLLPLFIIIYSQSILLLKETKIISLLVTTVILLFGIKYMSCPYEYWIYIQSNARNLYQTLKEVNPDLNNVISTDEIYEYYSGKKSLYSDPHIFDKDFSGSDLPKYIENLENGEYFIFLPDSDSNYMNGFKEYINKQNDFKIKKVFSEKQFDNTILVQIEK